MEGGRWNRKKRITVEGEMEQPTIILDQLWGDDEEENTRASLLFGTHIAPRNRLLCGEVTTSLYITSSICMS